MLLLRPSVGPGAAVLGDAIPIGTAGPLFLLSAGEAVFPPLAGPVLPLAGVAVAEGRMSFAAACAVAVLGATVGAVVLYSASRAIGRERVRNAMLRYSAWSRLRDEHFDRAESWFTRHADMAVLLGRCVPVIRSLVSVPAGLERMPFLRFLGLTALGNLMWSALVIRGTAAVGGRIELLQRHAAKTQMVVLFGWVIVLLALVVRHRLRRRSAAVTTLERRDAGPVESVTPVDAEDSTITESGSKDVPI